MMAVYVDDAEIKYGRMIMSHMLADTPGELHSMADEIGIQRKWYQGPDKASTPHYDISLSKRALAIKAGAVFLQGRHEIWPHLKRIKEDFRNNPERWKYAD